ncbi:MAG: L-asparaginase 1, partial [Bacteroidaceae bacterium]|nr:L-asparaginase 1 [Bacteroidaceae bacterium]
TKINAEQFNAFRSFNYPELATAGINIQYNEYFIRRPNPLKSMKAHFKVDTNVMVLTLFPGIQQAMVHTLLHQTGLKAVVLRTFGAGNAPQIPWLKEELTEARRKGIVLVNITQCQAGSVHMGLYETSLPLLDAGLVSGYDSTPECAITKLMFLLGQGFSAEEIRVKMDSDIAGEITKPVSEETAHQ